MTSYEQRIAVNPFGPSLYAEAEELEAETRTGGHGHAYPAPAGDAQALRVSVDNNWCRLYGICEQEAPEVFDLGADGRLRYTARPAAGLAPQVRQAARCCPMQAVTLTEVNR